MKQAIYILLLLSCIECNYSKHTKSVPHTYNNNEYISIDSIVWKIHFQKGFINDSVSVVFNDDTLTYTEDFKNLNISSLGNGCSNIYVICFRDKGKYQSAVKYDNNFFVLKKVKTIDVKETDMQIIINGHKFDINLGLEKGRFISINYYRNNKSIIYFISENKNTMECL